ncbi:MAG: SagB/ThcOx family dehydrogenase [Bryobacteraceae bacterium]|nr:SagB/ThcOx family dehydrogenase [Bryobacteraceae bacterium]
MRSPNRLRLLAPAILLALLPFPGRAEDDAAIRLPPPRTDGGRPLMQVLKERKTAREFLDKPLPAGMLSDLLWAAFGVNRPDGKRTAPSAWDHQEIELYVFTARGVHIYDAKGQELKRVTGDDLRAATGDVDFARRAPVTLAYVADYSKMVKSESDRKPFYAALDTGFIAQNVYLYCASAGLGTVVHDATDKTALATKLRLRPDQHIVLAQAIGFAAP